MYTPDSLLTSAGTGTRDAWVAELTRRGADAPDAIVDAYMRYSAVVGLNYDLAIAQGIVESAGFTDWKWIQNRNPAGLGSTSRQTPGASFPSIEAGITAQLAHLCAYAYTADTCPVERLGDEYADLFNDPRHALVNHRGHPEIGYLNGRWAVPGTSYAQSICAVANAIASGPASPPTPGGNMPRIIVHAGHENIGNITSDPNGVINPAALRGGTGANGEMAFNSAWADELTRLLLATGADAVRTDAIYHANVYDQDADLVVAGHYDGGSGTGHPQYCMASTVHSGPSTEAADALADVIVQEWYDSYPAAMGIAGNGPITVDMEQYYGGWYRTADTPMLLIEHCLGADANGIRADRPTPQAAAAADFTVLAKHFGLSGNAPAPQPTPDTRTFPETGRTITGNIKGYFERFGKDAQAIETSVEVYGLPVSDLRTENGLPVQYFERAVLEDHAAEGKGVMSRRLGSAAAAAAGLSGPGIP